MKILFFIFTLFWIGNLQSQDPYAIQISLATGLPSSTVYDVLQDKKGFLWFATNEGVSRYDGYEFKTFQSPLQTSTAGSCLREDAFGRIWYENFDGILYYIQDEKMHRLQNMKQFDYFQFAVLEKHLFVVQAEGVAIFDLKTLKRIQTIPLDGTRVASTAANKSSFYLVTKHSIFRITDALKTTNSYHFFNTTESLRPNQIFVSDETVLLTNKLNNPREIHVMSSDLNYVKKIESPDYEVINQISILHKKAWVQTPKGIYLVDLKTGKLIHHYFKEKSISNIIQDRQNNYWVSSPNEGIFIIPDFSVKFYRTNGIIPSKIVSLENDFLIGSKKGEFLQVSKDLTTSKLIYQYSNNAHIHYLHYQENQKKTYFSSSQFYILNGLNFKNAISNSISVKQIIQLDDKYMAFAASSISGILLNPSFKNKKSHWDVLFNSFHYHPDSTMKLSFVGMRMRTVFLDETKKHLYFSGNTGLFRADTLGNIQEIKHDGNSFLATTLLGFNGDIYALSTRGNLFRISKTGEFTLLNKSLGIEEYGIRAIRKDQSRLVVLSNSYFHLYQLDSKKTQIINFNINPYEVNDFLIDQNRLILLTNAGIISFDLNLTNNAKSSARFFINTVKINNLIIPKTKLKRLSFEENDLTISFSILDFGTIHSEPIFYQINGGNWKKIPLNSRTLEFPSLKHGSYVIAFKLGNTILDENIEFTIQPPFWQTWWFILFVSLVVLLIGRTLYKRRIQVLSNKIELLNEKVILEQQLGKSILTSIKSQMNPHFFYNALNTIQAYIFTNDRRNASVYLAKFSKLTRMILEMSEKEIIHLQEETTALSLYLELEKMRFDGDFEFEITPSESLDMELVKIPPMLIQPYVENSIKHGLLHQRGEKWLTIKLDKLENRLIVTIDDNGIGREKSQQMQRNQQKHQSFSTKANEKRLEILNRSSNQHVGVEITDKKDEQGNSLGTTVQLNIPIS